MYVFSGYISGPRFALGCFTMPRVKFLFFLSEVFKRFLAENHVLGSFFFFLYFFCNEGALNSHQSNLALRVSVTMS